MEDLLKIQQKLIPEVIEIMTKRYLSFERNIFKWPNRKKSFGK